MTEWGWAERIPDIVEPIRAARVWKSAEFVLSSVGMVGPAPWVPGENTARCFSPSVEGRHPVPASRCACGFWGLCSPTELLARFSHPAYEREPLVAGVIEMWGTVVPGTLGWRSSRARVVALVAPLTREHPVFVPREVVTSEGWSAKLTDLVVKTMVRPVPGFCDEGATRRLASMYNVPMLDTWPELSPPLVKETEDA